jgi:hypothetical protein
MDLTTITLYETEGSNKDNSSIYTVSRTFENALNDCVSFLNIYENARITEIKVLGIA